jgi:diadenylate cyclase
MLGEIWKQVLQVGFFAVGIYLILRFLRETRGSSVIRGLTFVLVFVVVSFITLIEWLQLEELALAFRYVSNWAIIGLIVVFQPEIRNAIVRLGQTNLFGRFLKREVQVLSRLLRSVARLSRDQIGALIAIERQNALTALAETGITIDAELNSYLIESVFYPGNSLHDGAVVVRDDRIVAASCLLPLSQNPEVDKRLGTRHRAALGLAEETDALVVVVSEETGKISVAINGKLNHGVSLEELERIIKQSMNEKVGRP